MAVSIPLGIRSLVVTVCCDNNDSRRTGSDQLGRQLLAVLPAPSHEYTYGVPRKDTPRYRKHRHLYRNSRVLYANSPILVCFWRSESDPRGRISVAKLLFSVPNGRFPGRNGPFRDRLVVFGTDRVWFGGGSVVAMWGLTGLLDLR
jgi:hypothetical protein